MKVKESSGYITVKDEYGIEYFIAKINQYHYEDDTFSFTFEPFWSVIDSVKGRYYLFDGIPGLNLDKRKTLYVREKMIPVYIAERVPPRNRVNLNDCLKEAGITYWDPIAYLLGTKLQYFGDNFYMTKVSEKKTVNIDTKKEGRKNTSAIIKDVLVNLAHNNDVIYNGNLIDDSNRAVMFRTLFDIYEKEIKSNKIKQKAGIEKAKKENKYRGRKPIEVSHVKFYEEHKKVEEGKITARKAAENLGISIDKYYRLRKQLSH